MSNNSPFDLSGKSALVTGGNGGIGLGMARGLASAGARVVVAARNQAKSDAAVRELEKLGGQPLSIAVDVADEASVNALIRSTQDRCGRLDILVNNAGTNVRKQPQDYTLADWHHVLDTNLTSAFLCSRGAYAPMKAVGGGKIINIGSMMSIFGWGTMEDMAGVAVFLASAASDFVTGTAIPVDGGYSVLGSDTTGRTSPTISFVTAQRPC